MKKVEIFEVLFCLIFLSIKVCICDDTRVAIFNNNNTIVESSQQSSIRIFPGAFVGLITRLKETKFLPLCSMVGCATNATQCKEYGGKEMLNKVSVDNYTQSYFKSVFTLDKTFLSINCNKVLVPCCFPQEPLRIQGLPQLTLPDKGTIVSKISSIISSIPPMNIFLLSNICLGLVGGAGDIDCNSD